MRKTQLAIAIPLALLASQSVQAQNVDLASFTNGFRIDGANAGDFSGRSVSGAGDVNGDGLADLMNLRGQNLRGQSQVPEWSYSIVTTITSWNAVSLLCQSMTQSVERTPEVS